MAGDDKRRVFEHSAFPGGEVMQFMEHRYGSRIGLDTCVSLNYGNPAGARCSGRLRSLSLSGGLIQAEVTLPRLARVDVELASVWIPAFVIRTGVRELAIEWCQLAPAAVREFLKGTSRKAQREPDQLEEPACL